METWRSVVGWDGLYEVSDAGRVRSLAREMRVRTRHGTETLRRWPGRVLAAPVGGHGYRTVTLSTQGREPVCFNVHTLVMLAFAGPPPSGLETCHNNGVRTDNRFVNLRYDTRSANSLDRVAHGTVPRLVGEKCGSAKLTAATVVAIRAAEGKESARALGRRYGVHHQTIRAAQKKIHWAHV